VDSARGNRVLVSQKTEELTGIVEDGS
jgi:hypothetical protein